MPGEVGHQPGELFVGASLDQLRRWRLRRRDRRAGACAMPRRPGRPARNRAGSGSWSIHCAQQVAAGLGEGRFQQGAVFEDHHVPAERAEQRLVARPQALADHGVEALPVVVDDPPAVPQPLLPALEHRLEDIAFVESRRPRPARSSGLPGGRVPSRARARSPGPATRTASARRQARPSRWRSPRRRRPWCATDSSARPCSRGTLRASPASAGPADTGSHGRSARRAA